VELCSSRSPLFSATVALREHDRLAERAYSDCDAYVDDSRRARRKENVDGKTDTSSAGSLGTADERGRQCDEQPGRPGRGQGGGEPRSPGRAGRGHGVEVVAVGALQLTRDILLSTVSGAANIGAEALTATVSGIRGVVSATSHMVGDIAGTAQATFQEALSGARQTRRTAAATGLRRPTLRPVPARGGDSTVPAPTGAARARRRGRQPRAGGGQAATVAA
jgi:hypothetical protein